MRPKGPLLQPSHAKQRKVEWWNCWSGAMFCPVKTFWPQGELERSGLHTACRWGMEPTAVGGRVHQHVTPRNWFGLILCVVGPEGGRWCGNIAGSERGTMTSVPKQGK